MRFHRHVTREVRELLTEQLKEYESRTPMSREERRELHDWVAEGKSPYDNGDYICGESGLPLDFISTLRASRELQDWFASLSEEEKEAERRSNCALYSTETDEVCFDLTAFPLPDMEDCDLPFQ